MPLGSSISTLAVSLCLFHISYFITQPFFFFSLCVLVTLADNKIGLDSLPSLLQSVAQNSQIKELHLESMLNSHRFWHPILFFFFFFFLFHFHFPDCADNNLKRSSSNALGDFVSHNSGVTHINLKGFFFFFFFPTKISIAISFHHLLRPLSPFLANPGNKLDDEAVFVIASALSRNTNLLSLNLLCTTKSFRFFIIRPVPHMRVPGCRQHL